MTTGYYYISVRQLHSHIIMLLLFVISSIAVFGVQGQINATQNGGITNGVSNTQPTLNNADAIKVAETLIQTANQLLSILKRGSVPTVLCPNGRPQSHCDPDPCATWDCSNIAGVQCEHACDSCDPIFKTRGRDVTSICEMRRVQIPFHLMNTAISPFDTFASEVISALDLDFLPGDFIDRPDPTPPTTPSANEDSYPQKARRRQAPRKKKVQKKTKNNKIQKKRQKIVQTTTTAAPEPRVLRKHDISPRIQNNKPVVNPRIQDVQYKNKNVTESYLLPSRNQIYQQPVHPNALSSSFMDQIPLPSLTHLLPEARSVIDSRNTIYSHRQTPQATQSSQQAPVAVHQPMLSNMVVNYKNQRTKLLPLTPSQFSKINNDPNRNAILQSLRDVLGAKPFSNTMHMNVKSGNSMAEARPVSANGQHMARPVSADGQNFIQNTIIETGIPFQRKGLGPLRFFN